MLANIGIPGLVLVLVLALILFGPSRLPQIGRAFGRTIKEFKDSTNGLMWEQEEKRESSDASSVKKTDDRQEEQKEIPGKA